MQLFSCIGMNTHMQCPWVHAPPHRVILNEVCAYQASSVFLCSCLEGTYLKKYVPKCTRSKGEGWLTGHWNPITN